MTVGQRNAGETPALRLKRRLCSHFKARGESKGASMTPDRSCQHVARICAAAWAVFFLAAFLLTDFRWDSVTSAGPEAGPQHGPVMTFTLIDEIRAWHDRPYGGFPALDFAARATLSMAVVAALLAAVGLRRLAVATATLSAVSWLL